MKKTKIAICINGVIREPESSVEYLKDFIEKIPNSEVDIFLYTSKRSQFNISAQQYHHNKYKYLQNNTFYLDDNDIKIFFDTFNIRDYHIEEDFKELEEIVFSRLQKEQAVCWERDFYRPVHQFYGAEKCNNLKKKYEEENNFKYDVVFRFRPDLFLKWIERDGFPPKNYEDWQRYIFDNKYQERGRLNQIFVSYIDIIQGMNRLGDNFMYGNSSSMDNYFKDITINSIDFWKDDKNLTIYEGISKYRPAPESLWANQARVRKSTVKFAKGFWHDVIRRPIPFFEDGEAGIQQIRVLNAKSCINDRKQRAISMNKRIKELNDLIKQCNEGDPLINDYKHRIKTIEIEIEWLDYGTQRDIEVLKNMQKINNI